MSRSVMSLVVSMSFAGAVALHAQEAQIKTETTVKADQAKTVTYTGCVQSGSEAQSFVLQEAVPVGQTTRTVVGTAGAVTATTTTYALVPTETIVLTPHVGKKVEVTGVMLSGETKTETKTTIDRENAKDTTVTSTTKSDDSMPKFQVTSLKHLADSCTM